MKKDLRTLLLLLAMFACTKNSDSGVSLATSVVLNQDKVDIMVGETATIKATVLPESLNMGVVWSVVDTAYAEVRDGVIKGKAEGVTYVIATSADGVKKAACMVSVNPPVHYSVSITNSLSQPLAGVYGYPGMTTVLYASTSDGETHSFTWEVEDQEAGSITDDGCLTFGKATSTDPEFVYDVKSYVKVTTEDGYGCRIPIRSSILNGIKVDDEYTQAGTPVFIVENGSYALALLYRGAETDLEIPATGVNVELSNNTDFTIKNIGGAYTLTTGKSTGVSTKLSISAIGTTEKVEVAEIKIDKTYDIKAQLVSASSATLAFTWTEKVSGADDASKPYTITLYSDADCTTPVKSYSISAGHSCWTGAQPRFVFTKLTPATTYYFRAYDTTDATERTSNIVTATTEAFTNVQMPDKITDKGIVLAENFGELGWYDDLVSQAAGCTTPSDDSSFANEGNSFINYHASGEPVLFTKSTALANSRLNGWANGKNNQCYVHAGMIKFGTSSAKNYLFTPAFTVESGKKAKVVLTIEVSSYAAGETTTLAAGVINVTPSDHRVSSFTLPSGDGKYTEGSLSSKIEWKTVTFSELTVEPGERIVIGPTNAASAKSRYILRKVIAEVTEIN